MNLFLENGYVNVSMINSLPYPFVFCWGGRATGKTYGALWEDVTTYRGKFVHMRRTQTELDLIASSALNPFSKINEDKGTNYNVQPMKNMASVRDENGEQIGVMLALSTCANVRGWDASNVELISYDEFIPEYHKRSSIKNEHLALLNCYESINRNRELQGKTPVKLRCYANSNDFFNPLFVGLNLITKIEKMQSSGKYTYIDSERGYMLIDLGESPISQKKAKTALYKFAGDGDFSNMAIENRFKNDLFPPHPCPIREYRPLVHVGELTIYKHKSANKYYCSDHNSGNPPEYTASDTELKMFRFAYGHLVSVYYRGAIDFERTIQQVLFLRYFALL